MNTKEVIIKPHHLGLFVASRIEPARITNYRKNFISRIAVYDDVSTREANRFLAEILALPSDTPIKFTYGPDRICEACPRNIKGSRFNPDLDKDVPEGYRVKPCDPDNLVPRWIEDDDLIWLKQISETDEITTKIIPR